MKYDVKTLKEKAIEAINKNKLIFVEDICAMIGIDKASYYKYFKVGDDNFNELRKMLEVNKINLKVSLRKKWFESDNATTQMALYKLCSTDIEHKKLQQNYSDVTSGGEKIQVVDPFAQIRINNGIDPETETSDNTTNG